LTGLALNLFDLQQDWARHSWPNALYGGRPRFFNRIEFDL
jgi:hypothetical protein